MREERGGSREKVWREEGEKKERERKEREIERRSCLGLFGFLKLEFMLFLDFWIEISFSHNFDRVFDF